MGWGREKGEKKKKTESKRKIVKISPFFIRVHLDGEKLFGKTQKIHYIDN